MRSLHIRWWLGECWRDPRFVWLVLFAMLHSWCMSRWWDVRHWLAGPDHVYCVPGRHFVHESAAWLGPGFVGCTWRCFHCRSVPADAPHIGDMWTREEWGTARAKEWAYWQTRARG